VNAGFEVIQKIYSQFIGAHSKTINSDHDQQSEISLIVCIVVGNHAHAGSLHAACSLVGAVT